MARDSRLKTKNMKPTILKLNFILLLLFLIGTGCEKDDWTPIELTVNSCNNAIGVIDTINNITGIIERRDEISTTIYFIIVEDAESGEELFYMPCNLPEKYFKNGLKIKFNGEVLNLDDTVQSTSVSIDLLGTPIRLLNAEYK